MKPFRKITIRPMMIGLMALTLGSCNEQPQHSRVAHAQESAPNQSDTRIGFHSRNQLHEHFAKHGTEFGNISEEEYLRAAQELRDRTVGDEVLEIVRDDGTVSRFDRSSGAFLAFNRDGTIRTFFKPNDGERYFRRQAQRTH